MEKACLVKHFSLQDMLEVEYPCSINTTCRDTESSYCGKTWRGAQ